MKAATIQSFGSADKLTIQDILMPDLKEDQVLIKVAYAGIGKWDIFEREGWFAKVYPGEPSFPYVLGSEGAGEIVKIGAAVKDLVPGDMVYAMVGARNPKGGFYADYVAVDANDTWRIPPEIKLQEAAALAIEGGTALRGMQDVLHVKPGMRIMIIGASGGLGHVAVQIAKSMGAYVIAIASGEDGVELVKSLGADEAIDGKLSPKEGVLPKKLDGIFITTGGDMAEQLLQKVDCQNIAFPNGVQLKPETVQRARSYNADYDAKLMDRLYAIASKGELHVHISQNHSLENMAEAHADLGKHHLGRIVVRV